VKKTGLDILADRIAACRICVENPEGRPLPHDPRPVFQLSTEARLLIAGQAPGTRVHQSGQPFTDPSGDRLRAWMGVTPEVFYDRRKVAILAMGFCFPGLNDKGGDLPPRKECAPAWRQQVMTHLPDLQLVLAVGRYAQLWHMPGLVATTLHETVTNWRRGLDLSPAVIPLPHPSWRNSGWLKRNPWFEVEVLPELRSRVARLLTPMNNTHLRGRGAAAIGSPCRASARKTS